MKPTEILENINVNVEETMSGAIAIKEVELTPKQINKLFTNIETKLTKAGGNRTAIGKGKDFIQGLVKEGPMDWVKTKGKNLTTKITADKLNSIWKKLGSPSDSKSIFNLLVQNNIDPTVAKLVFKSMKIPVPRIASGGSGGVTGGAAKKGITMPSATKKSTTKPATTLQAKTRARKTASPAQKTQQSQQQLQQVKTQASQPKYDPNQPAPTDNAQARALGFNSLDHYRKLRQDYRTQNAKYDPSKPAPKDHAEARALGFNNLDHYNQVRSAAEGSAIQQKPASFSNAMKTNQPSAVPNVGTYQQAAKLQTGQNKPQTTAQMPNFSNAMKTNQPSAVPNVGTYQQANKLRVGQGNTPVAPTAQISPQSTTAAPAAKKPTRTRKAPDKKTVTESVQNSKEKIMENVDKDIAAMLTSLKKYDKLTESVAPVLQRKTVDEQTEKVDQDLDEKAKKNPYAIGMAQAMKSTGDKPPLEKSTITMAHDIAKSIERNDESYTEEDTNEPDQEVMEWMERFRKLG